MAMGFVSHSSIGEVIKIVGLFRNQANFAMFMLEESFQTLNMVAMAMYRNSDFRQCYSTSTYAIQELIGWIQLASTPIISNAMFPMNLAYIAFFRTELDAFIDFRDKSLAKMNVDPQGTGVFDQTLVEQLVNKADPSDWYIDADGELKQISATGVWENSSLWTTRAE